MKRMLALVSICLNVALAAWVMALLHIRHRAPSSLPTSLKMSARMVPAVPLPGRAGLKSVSAEVPPLAHFDWHQVESEDYKQYLANLRAIGCPEKTVRDIIVADVNDLFASKMAAATRTNQYQYWRKEPFSRSEEQAKELRDLYAQKREVLKMLGVDSPDFKDLLWEAFRDNVEEPDLQLAFLPESKRQQVKEALFGQAQQQVADGNDSSRYDAI